MSRVRTHVFRARMALVALALWLSGVELIPALHQALHHRLGAHRHDGNSIVALSPEAPFATTFRTSFAGSSHRHADGSLHASDGEHHRRTRRDAELCIDNPALPCGSAASPGAGLVDLPSDAGHASGLAHHAAALAPVRPPLTQPLPVDRRPTLVVDTVADAITDRVAPVAVARGPPLAA